MKILVVGLNYAPEKVGIAVYTTGMAEELAALGHEVRVIAGQPYYPAWKIMDGHNAWWWSTRGENGVRVTRVPHFIPARPTGAKRLIHHATFAISALMPSLWSALTFQPDLVLTVAPSLIGAPVARLAAGISGAKSWLHIQDFEVEAAFATGLLAEGRRAAKLARGFERWVVAGFDRVSSISPQMVKRLVDKGIPADRTYEFRNWADVEAIQPLEHVSPYRAEWGITSQHVALYSGNIANKQGIEIVVEAARRLDGRCDVTFVVCGEGPNRANLEAMAADLSNIRFHDLQPRERLNDLMGLANVHLLPQIGGAADLVLPSKLTNMLASGRPVVATAERGTGLFAEVDGAALVVSPGDGAALAQAVERIMTDEALATALGQAARQLAEQRWSKRHILAAFNERLLTLGNRCADPMMAVKAAPRTGEGS